MSAQPWSDTLLRQRLDRGLDARGRSSGSRHTAMLASSEEVKNEHIYILANFDALFSEQFIFSRWRENPVAVQLFRDVLIPDCHVFYPIG
jgi:hypothetical protein